MIPESHKKLVSELQRIQSELGVSISFILNIVPEIEISQEEIDANIIHSSRLVAIYQNFPWNNTEKYKRIMEILLEDE